MSNALIYVAHPYGGNPEQLVEAHRRRCELTGHSTMRKLPVVFWAPWIPLCQTRGEDQQDRCLRFDIEAVSLSHGVLSFDLAQDSPGCRSECTAAVALGIPVLRVHIGYRAPGRIMSDNHETLQLNEFLDQCIARANL